MSEDRSGPAHPRNIRPECVAGGGPIQRQERGTSALRAKELPKATALTTWRDFGGRHEIACHNNCDPDPGIKDLGGWYCEVDMLTVAPPSSGRWARLEVPTATPVVAPIREGRDLGSGEGLWKCPHSARINEAVINPVPSTMA